MGTILIESALLTASFFFITVFGIDQLIEARTSGWIGITIGICCLVLAEKLYKKRFNRRN